MAWMGVGRAMRDAAAAGYPVFNAQGILATVLSELIQGPPLSAPLVST